MSEQASDERVAEVLGRNLLPLREYECGVCANLARYAGDLLWKLRQQLARADAAEATLEEMSKAHEGQLRCEDCALPYARFPLDVNVDDEVWQKIMGRPGGILCANCIANRALRHPGVTVGHLTFDGSLAQEDAAEALVAELEASDEQRHE